MNKGASATIGTEYIAVITGPRVSETSRLDDSIRPKAIPITAATGKDAATAVIVATALVHRSPERASRIKATATSAGGTRRRRLVTTVVARNCHSASTIRIDTVIRVAAAARVLPSRNARTVRYAAAAALVSWRARAWLARPRCAVTMPSR